MNIWRIPPVDRNRSCFGRLEPARQNVSGQDVSLTNRRILNPYTGRASERRAAVCHCDVLVTRFAVRGSLGIFQATLGSQPLPPLGGTLYHGLSLVIALNVDTSGLARRHVVRQAEMWAHIVVIELQSDQS